VGSATDPTGPSLGTLRVYRGGGLYSNARDCRSPNRYGLAPGSRGLRLGFRVALAPQVSR